MTREFHPVLGLIPAKLGSTRLPEKNIRPLAGKPLIAWTIEAGGASGVIDRLVVSTEDERVARVARKHGAEVPFLRPAELARDPARVVQVALHALETLRKQGAEFKTLVILLPTCPLRTAGDIKDAFSFFKKKNGLFLMSVGQYSHTPFAALDLRKNGLLKPFFPKYIGKRTQQHPAAWRANGAMHILDVAAFEKTRSYYSEPLLGYPLPPERSVDIDGEADFHEAQFHLARKG